MKVVLVCPHWSFWVRKNSIKILAANAADTERYNNYRLQADNSLSASRMEASLSDVQTERDFDPVMHYYWGHGECRSGQAYKHEVLFTEWRASVGIRLNRISCFYNIEAEQGIPFWKCISALYQWVSNVQFYVPRYLVYLPNLTRGFFYYKLNEFSEWII